MTATLTRPDTADLLATARSLGPLIHEHAAEGERERRLSRPVLEALTTAGLTRLLLPRALGGLEVDRQRGSMLRISVILPSSLKRAHPAAVTRVPSAYSFS